MPVAELEGPFIDLIAREIACRPDQVAAAAALLDEGATVAFIARYRKERTSGLDDEQLEKLAKRRVYFLDLTERRDVILEAVSSQGKLTDELESAIRAAVTKQELEDLYLPYKAKRRTRAAIARERGLEALATALLDATEEDPHKMARSFVDPDRGVVDTESALAGARDIIAEQLAEDASNRGRLRLTFAERSQLTVCGVSDRETEGAAYRDYFDHVEAAKSIPSHRLLAILRGEREGFLVSTLVIDDDAEIEKLAASLDRPLTGACGAQLTSAARDAYKRLLRPSITNEVRTDLRERAEAEAIRVFRANLQALLGQAPFGRLPVLGLDPGLRTGCKVAAVDSTGKVVAATVIHPLTPAGNPEAAATTLVELVTKHAVRAVAIGNGTASRETEIFARKALAPAGRDDVIVVIVPETGASVYSASALAREELPDLDVSLRGAVSIARRLQDPLAELVKIEPRSLGIGQYQHDVDQRALASELDCAVEAVVNSVGVELNTASPTLLRRVSGISDRLARSIVARRDAHGPFSSRRALLKVPSLGAKTFEQAAGFLRILGAPNPLDSTAVHPERYAVVEAMAKGLGVSLVEVVGTPSLVARLDLREFIDEQRELGLPTLEDIRAELERPGRDPRPDFEAPRWRDDVVSVDDIQPGMTLEGRVSNVTNFGAFVDIGIKRDGLVHVSELSHHWIDDPRNAVHVGQIVRVKVLEVDHDRNRISLSIKALQDPPARPRPTQRPDPQRTAHHSGRPTADDLARTLNRGRK